MVRQSHWICLTGSFGFCDPASKEMHIYLERLEEQQRMVLEMISGKKQELIMSYATKGRSGKQVRPPNVLQINIKAHP